MQRHNFLRNYHLSHTGLIGHPESGNPSNFWATCRTELLKSFDDFAQYGMFPRAFQLLPSSTPKVIYNKSLNITFFNHNFYF